MVGRVLLVVGAAVVAAGLALGLTPLRVGGRECGSAFVAYGNAASREVCGLPRSQQAGWGVALVVAGGVLALGSVLLPRS
jgi:hypothetical protein